MATLRERLSSAAFGAGWSLVCRLPESVARALFNFGADTAWRKQGGGVRVLEGNLLRIFRTDPAYSPGVQPDGTYVDEGKELRTLSREVMRSYGRYYLETFRMQAIPAERIAAGMHVNFDQADLALEYVKNGRGVIFALPHMGDFELTGKWIIGYGAARSPPWPSDSSPMRSSRCSSTSGRAWAWRYCRPPAARTRSGSWRSACGRASWSAWSPTGTCPTPGSRWTSSARRRSSRPARPPWRSRPGRR